MAKAAPNVPAKQLAQYEALVALFPDVDRKGAKNPYTSRNGHMFSFLQPSGRLALRLPADEREAFQKKHRSEPVVSYGAVMKEYVEVPPGLLAKPRDCARYFRMSFEYIGTLKPKATTKPAAKKKSAAKKKKS